MKKNKAFSLLEISIVILIVGLMLAIMIQSSTSVIEAKLKSAINLTRHAPVRHVDNLELWLESTLPESFIASEVGEGLNVTTWYDINPQTEVKNNVTRATNNSKITYSETGMDGLPALYFNGAGGAGSYLTGNLVPGPTNRNFSFFIVSKSTDTSSVTKTAMTNGLPLVGKAWAYKKCLTYRCLTLVGSGDTPAGNINRNLVEIISATYKGAGTVSNVYLNGQQVLNSTSSTLSGNDIGFFLVGDYTTSSLEHWLGYISEIIVFSDLISTDDRKEIEKYLGKKYRISIRHTD